MNKNVVIISYEMNFVIGSMRGMLEDNGYGVTMLKPLVSSINNMVPTTDVFFISPSGMDSNALLNLLVFMKDICIEKSKFVIPIGTKEDIESIKRALPEEVIPGEVEKPFAVDRFRRIMTNVENVIDNELSRKRILIIDDNKISLAKTKSLLDGKYNVTVASSAMKGIISLSRIEPDLILIDYLMPICDGKQCLSMIRHEPETEKIPVIFLTGVKDMDKVRDAINENPDGYLLKDMPAREFRQFIDSFFYKKGMEESAT
ncbi:MAG: response regulator [Lachnospiraceae bacterium]|nr:response regulator [Lachnospiraceae bacterium]